MMINVEAHNMDEKVPIIFFDEATQENDILFVSSSLLDMSSFHLIDKLNPMSRASSHVDIPKRTASKPNLFVTHRDGDDIRIHAVSSVSFNQMKSKMLTDELLLFHFKRGTRPLRHSLERCEQHRSRQYFLTLE